MLQFFYLIAGLGISISHAEEIILHFTSSDVARRSMQTKR